jgi:hypothetical protein
MTFFLVLWSVAAGVTAALSNAHRELFEPYFGGAHPVLAMGLVGILGGLSLGYLRLGGWFAIYEPRIVRRGLAASAVLATLFAAAMVAADLAVGIPKRSPVPLPESLLFYPAMALAVEVAFHTVPLAVLLLALRPVTGANRPDSVIWFCILLTACIEPVYQMGVQGRPLALAGVLVGAHVLAVNIVQLYLFRRYDFLAMYSFRFVYYIHWHILWGSFRTA